MINGFNIKTIKDAGIKNKQVLMRVDYNVPLTKDGKVANDLRIKKTLDSLKYLLKNNNRLILFTHLGRPSGRDPKYSVQPIVDHLQKLFPSYTVSLIQDFEKQQDRIKSQADKEILLLENIRYYAREKKKSPKFAKKLADLADIYVNEAFAMSHRVQTSVVGVPIHAESYAGLLMKKEIEMLSKAMNNSKKPVVSIIGGAKISTKINLIEKLIRISDYIILGGGLANTFIKAQGYNIGKSICEYEEIEKARQLLYLGGSLGVIQILPQDVILGHPNNGHVKPKVASVEDVPNDAYILDIGPETRKLCVETIQKARTIIWNGPVGLFEQPEYAKGSISIYKAVVANTKAFSVVGGGDTLALIDGRKNVENITHLSTGGGAMLDFIEKGTLPGIAALQLAQKS